MQVFDINTDLSKLMVSKRVTKTDSNRVYEADLYMQCEDAHQTLLFWSPRLMCNLKDASHVTFDLPSDQEGEEFYTFLNNIDQNVITLSQGNWCNWFGNKDEDEDPADRYKSNIKVGSGECLRLLSTKLSSNLKCKYVSGDDTGNPFADGVTQLDNVRGLIELRRLVFGKSTFKGELIVHQLILEEQQESEQLPLNKYSNDTEWVSL
tara:strand:- start:136 stop:756 length:621 start_codon:yes stop_codon:yes gene_type:complete